MQDDADRKRSSDCCERLPISVVGVRHRIPSDAERVDVHAILAEARAFALERHVTQHHWPTGGVDVPVDARRRTPSNTVPGATVLKTVPYFFTFSCNNSRRRSGSSVSTTIS